MDHLSTKAANETHAICKSGNDSKASELENDSRIRTTKDSVAEVIKNNASHKTFENHTPLAYAEVSDAVEGGQNMDDSAVMADKVLHTNCKSSDNLTSAESVECASQCNTTDGSIEEAVGSQLSEELNENHLLVTSVLASGAVKEGTNENKSDGMSGLVSDNSLHDDDIDLPSTVNDRKQIFMPLDLRVDDPRIYGKWMWFSNGDIYRQDYVWMELQTLILNGLVILLESSTARKCIERGRYQGVIKCYTRGDKDTIKRAGLAIKKITMDNAILHYKSNQASKNSANRSYGDRFITEYMLTASGKFYEKDEVDRWRQVKEKQDEKSENFQNFTKAVHKRRIFSNAESFIKESIPGIYLSPHKREAESLPSEELKKFKYSYPLHSYVMEHDHSWKLFCDVTDFDSCGMTELDRTWIEVKKLCDEGVFRGVSCETYACFNRPHDNQLRRTLTCTVDDYYNVEKLIKSADMLRQRASYDRIMYMKVCYLNDKHKKMHRLRYMYTDDRDLYEYVDEDWKLIKKVW